MCARALTPRVDVVGLARALAGIALLAILPGWVWSRALFPALARLERLVLSVALSVALLAIALYVGNVVLGVRLSAAAAILWTAALVLAGWALMALRARPAPR